MTDRFPASIDLSVEPSAAVWYAKAVGDLSGYPSVSTLLRRVTGPQLFPIVVAGLLVLSAVTFAVRVLLGSERGKTTYRYYRTVGVLAGSSGVLVSLRIVLDSPDSIGALVVGTAGATVCYVAVLPRPFGTTRQPIAGQAVAVSSLLWIAGTLVVGGTAARNARHQVWGGIFGVSIAFVLVGLYRTHRGTRNERRAYRNAIATLAVAFLVPVCLTALVGEELAFVSYLVAVVLVVILWWFRRLAVAQR